MSILLPSSPGFRAGKPRLLDFGATIVPPGGGPAQRLNRLGNRFAIDVTLGTSRSDGAGMVAVSRLLQGLTQGVLYAFPQDFVPPYSAGSPVVDGNDQLGSTLNLEGLYAYLPVKEGQFISLIHNGRRYLHCITADVIATSAGKASLGIVPMLRVSPTDHDIVEIDQPKIEGFLSGNALEWQLQTAPFVDLSFTITEAA